MGSDDAKPVLTSAPPPWHSILLYVVMVSFFVYNLPSLKDLDREATLSVFQTTLFDMPTYFLVIFRSLFALVIFVTTGFAIANKQGVELCPPYLPSSKLKRVKFVMKGFKGMAPFTCWSWNLLGISFALNAYLASLSPNDTPPPPPQWILRTALVLWEITAPCTLLVAAVVKYALWPGFLRTNTPHSLYYIRPILMHNANVLFACLECFLLSGLPVRLDHASFAPLYGCVYLLFSWNMNMSWTDRHHGPQYIYFFFDTTVGPIVSYVLLALLGVLLAFYGLFGISHHLLDGRGLGTHVGLLVAVCGLVMRFRD